jgi:hypothetical protein
VHAVAPKAVKFSLHQGHVLSATDQSSSTFFQYLHFVSADFANVYFTLLSHLIFTSTACISIPACCILIQTSLMHSSCSDLKKKNGLELAYSSAIVYGGIRTASITWITPFEHSTSACITFALLTLTPPVVVIVRFPPCTVVRVVCIITSAAISLPDTTW